MKKWEKAKRITIEAWTYLAEHPEITQKSDLPDKLYSSLHQYEFDCPLCELYNRSSEVSMKDIDIACRGCPLDTAGANCIEAYQESPFNRWLKSDRTENPKAVRAEAAQELVDIVSAWQGPEWEEA